MKKLLIAGTIIGAALGLTWAADSSAYSVPENAGQLKERVAGLERRVAELEKLLVARDVPPQQPLRIIPSPQLDLVPPLSPGENPKVWGEGEINGLKYYIFPLNAAHNSE